MAMATVTGKRKREDAQVKPSHSNNPALEPSGNNGEINFASPPTLPEREVVKRTKIDVAVQSVAVQIVTGSYERVLHGICATIPATLVSTSNENSTSNAEGNGEGVGEDVVFSDTFLFEAHTSSIRCLAFSPLIGSSKRILATGGSDERINLYNISTTPPTLKDQLRSTSFKGTKSSQNSKNKSLGNLLHHDRAVSRLHFSAKSKLFSAAEDNTIAISRTRDWTVLSSIKAPIPNPQGRPSGDTAGPGEVPAGVNDFAIHPSQKLMLSVSRGERCMRLWNLMTGKKAGVLNFDRELLAQVGEGKFSTGEGRKVLWDEEGEIFVVGFEKGAVVFGIDSKPRAVVRPAPATKVHQMRFLPQSDGLADALAVSTEDGRVLFFKCETTSEDKDPLKLPSCQCIAELGGALAGMSGRIKDFDIIRLPSLADGVQDLLLIVTASSDGAVRLWTVSEHEIAKTTDAIVNGDIAEGEALNGDSKPTQQVGSLIGTLETGNRITCLGAFLMEGQAEEGGVEEGEEWVGLGAEGNGEEDDTSDNE